MNASVGRTVWAFTQAWNEEAMLPFYINHYSRLAERLIIYDAGSQDRTVELAQLCPKVEVRRFASNFQNNFEKAKLSNTCWKAARGLADFVVWSDVDEFIIPQDRVGWRTFFERNTGKTIFGGFDFNMVNVGDLSVLNVDAPLIEQVVLGSHINSMYQKTLLFSPNLLEIGYGPGHHHVSPQGSLEHGEIVHILHQKFALGLDFIEKRHRLLRSRRNPDAPIHGIHYLSPAGVMFSDIIRNARQLMPLTSKVFKPSVAILACSASTQSILQALEDPDGLSTLGGLLERLCFGVCTDISVINFSTTDMEICQSRRSNCQLFNEKDFFHTPRKWCDLIIAVDCDSILVLDAVHHIDVVISRQALQYEKQFAERGILLEIV
jgi:hypothetical protein